LDENVAACDRDPVAIRLFLRRLIFVCSRGAGALDRSAECWIHIKPAINEGHDVSLNAGGSATRFQVEMWLKTARFPIQNCGTTPVEYETFYTPKLKRVY
jgi:hypothetical protein